MDACACAVERECVSARAQIRTNANVVMAYIVMAYAGMAYIVMKYIVVPIWLWPI